MEPESSLPYSQAPATCLPDVWCRLQKHSPPEIRVGEYFTSGLFCPQRKHLAHEYFLTLFFYGEELLVPRPTPKLEDHPLSAVCDCLFDLFPATLHIGGRSSMRNLRTRHDVTGTHKHGLSCSENLIEIQVLWDTVWSVNSYWRFGGAWPSSSGSNGPVDFVSCCCFFCWYLMLIVKAKISGFDCLCYDTL